VFVPYAAWERNKEALKEKLLHFVRTAHERGIGAMPTMQYKFDEWKDKAAWPNSREFVADLSGHDWEGARSRNLGRGERARVLHPASLSRESLTHGTRPVHGQGVSRA
jgi:hypothetical protein